MEGQGSANCLSTVHAFKTLQKVFSSASVHCNNFLCLCILFSRPFKLPRPVLKLNDLTPKQSVLELNDLTPKQSWPSVWLILKQVRE